MTDKPEEEMLQEADRAVRKFIATCGESEVVRDIALWLTIKMRPGERRVGSDGGKTVPGGGKKPMARVHR